MFCPQCGARIRDDASFCPSCGAPARTKHAEEVAQPAPVEQQDRVDQPPMQAEPAFKEPSQSEEPMQKTRPLPQSGPASTPPSQPPAASGPGKSSSGSRSTAALILGIVSIVLGFTVLPGLVCGAIALVLAMQVKKQDGADGQTQGAIICSIIGLAISVCMMIVYFTAGPALFTFGGGGGGVPAPQVTQSSSTSTMPSSNASGSSTPSFSLSSKGSSAQIPQNSSSSALPKNTYVNSTYGFTIVAPSGFTKTADSNNTVTYENSSLGMKVVVSGFNNDNDLTPEKFIESRWQGYSNTQKQQEGNEALLVQTDGSKCIVNYGIIGTGSVNEIEVTFPVTGKDGDCINAMEDFIAGFTPGNVNVRH